MHLFVLLPYRILSVYNVSTCLILFFVFQMAKCHGKISQIGVFSQVLAISILTEGSGGNIQILHLTVMLLGLIVILLILLLS